MAIKTDLTWAELNTALIANGYSNAVVVSNGKVIIDIGVLVGESIDALTDGGVCETLYKLRDAAGVAHTTANTSLPTGEKLLSFPGYSYSSPDAAGEEGVTQVSNFTIPLNFNQILGSN